MQLAGTYASLCLSNIGTYPLVYSNVFRGVSMIEPLRFVDEMSSVCDPCAILQSTSHPVMTQKLYWPVGTAGIGSGYQRCSWDLRLPRGLLLQSTKAMQLKVVSYL